jgi:hypothetical protein
MGFNSSSDDNELLKLDLKLQTREHLSVRSLVDPACSARQMKIAHRLKLNADLFYTRDVFEVKR